jgi:hypothetical protein
METLEGRHLMAAFAWAPRPALTVEPDVLVAPLATAATREAAQWPFAADSPWNIGVGSGAQLAPITGGMSSSGANLNVNAWSIPVYHASNSDPLVSVYWGSSKVADFRIPAAAKADPQGDAHLTIIDPTGTKVMEILGTRWSGSNRIDADVAVVNSLTDAGVYPSYHGARAYGGSAIAGLIRKDELSAASIPHALAVAVDPSSLNRNAPGGKPYVWPANSADGGAGASYGIDGNLYMGSLLTIPRSVNVDSLGLSPQALAVARALQDYGAYVVDQGGGNIIYYAEPGSNVTTSGGELGRLTQYLRVVTNNSATNVGGGGSRFVESAPSFVGSDPVPTPTPIPEPTPTPEPTPVPPVVDDPAPSPDPAPVTQAWDIAGTMADRQGRALANVPVYLFASGTDEVVQVVFTDSRGTFVFSDVEPGVYAVAGDGGYGASRWTDEQVTVKNDDVLDVSLVINVNSSGSSGRRRR